MAEHTSESKPTNCRACGSANSVAFFECRDVPVDCGRLPETRAAAIAATRGDITLQQCLECGLVQNTSFDSHLIGFSPGYEAALVHSQSFLDFQSELADRLISRYSIRNKKIVEIGCGAGHFLTALCQKGNNLGIGIDPTVAKPGPNDRTGVTLVRDEFSDQHTEYPCDFICSLSVFEDIAEPAAFLRHVHKLAIPSRAPVYFEVFNGHRALLDREVWSIHYEQCNYFSLQSLAHTFERNGFAIRDAGACYHGDQYIYVEAVPVERVTLDRQLDTAVSDGLASSFALEYETQSVRWNQVLREARQRGEKVVLWGSGGKGITFLNSVELADTIEFVVDINPHRQSRFIPGTGHRIEAPEVLKANSPDMVIITNKIYRQEIADSMLAMNLSPRIEIA